MAGQQQRTTTAGSWQSVNASAGRGRELSRDTHGKERMKKERMKKERMKKERMKKERMKTERMKTERMKTERMARRNAWQDRTLEKSTENQETRYHVRTS
jgi:pentapeptide MXKDX repeat protein